MKNALLLQPMPEGENAAVVVRGDDRLDEKKNSKFPFPHLLDSHLNSLQQLGVQLR